MTSRHCDPGPESDSRQRKRPGGRSGITNGAIIPGLPLAGALRETRGWGSDGDVAP